MTDLPTSPSPRPDGLLARDRDSMVDSGPSADAFEQLSARVAADTVDRPTSLRAWLSEAATPVRLTIAGAGVMAVMLIAMVTGGLRADMRSVELVRFIPALTSVVALLAIVLTLTLRGLHRRPMGRALWAILGAAFLLQLGLALFPEIYLSSPAVVPLVDDMEGGALSCLMYGVVTGAPLGLLIWLLQRSDRPPAWRLAGAGCVGGMAAFAALQLHCPSHDPGHLLLQHGLTSLGLAVVAVALGYFVAKVGHA